MQIISSGVDGIKVQLWEAITGYRHEYRKMDCRSSWGCSCETVLCQKGGTLLYTKFLYGKTIHQDEESTNLHRIHRREVSFYSR